MTDSHKQLLDFERRWRGNPAGKDHVIVNELGMRPTVYYQRLNALLDDPEALAAEPMLINRLRRLRDQRRHMRRTA